ncbi:mortality factor 4-like protein 1 isoform X1 [Hippoglossus hippoglossus]|uniref:mortality factor 4-like protein 1 isoform X1 n=1 Tax=Hippoglossus hippoglossus TaxID=8267 RepID=UPI00148CB93D|nr:mortality factor 4-like protein 1 isoform X1 [Hippoglossus hippoglossus]
MAPKQEPKPKFQEGERVLCFHGPLLYEAKCVKISIKDKQIKYFIHYSGWNKNWDEWVPESRVLKYVDSNLAKQKELQKANQDHYVEGKMRGLAPSKKIAAVQQKNVDLKVKKAKQKTPGPGEGTSSGETLQGPRKKRARVDPTVESEEMFTNRVEVKVKIPEEMKPWLVDDWDLITRQKQLFHLPAKKNIETVLEDYANYKKSKGNSDNKEYAVSEVVAGIREYFNVMLGTQLLYKFERPQYAEILAEHPDMPMSQVYGAPHLLRLFVRIGAMLAYTPLDEKSLALLLSYLQDFLKLKKQCSHCCEVTVPQAALWCYWCIPSDICYCCMHVFISVSSATPVQSNAGPQGQHSTVNVFVSLSCVFVSICKKKKKVSTQSLSCFTLSSCSYPVDLFCVITVLSGFITNMEEQLTVASIHSSPLHHSTSDIKDFKDPRGTWFNIHLPRQEQRHPSFMHMCSAQEMYRLCHVKES